MTWVTYKDLSALSNGAENFSAEVQADVQVIADLNGDGIQDGIATNYKLIVSSGKKTEEEQQLEAKIFFDQLPWSFTEIEFEPLERNDSGEFCANAIYSSISNDVPVFYGLADGSFGLSPIPVGEKLVHEGSEFLVRSVSPSYWNQSSQSLSLEGQALLFGEDKSVQTRDFPQHGVNEGTVIRLRQFKRIKVPFSELP